MPPLVGPWFWLAHSGPSRTWDRGGVTDAYSSLADVSAVEGVTLFQQQIDAVEKNIAGVVGEIKAAEEKILSVEEKILAVEEKILAVERQIEEATDPDEKKSLREKEKSLREKEKSLRDEKKSLREKEKSLRDEKESLRDEKESLREKEKSLRDEESLRQVILLQMQGSTRTSFRTHLACFVGHNPVGRVSVLPSDSVSLHVGGFGAEDSFCRACTMLSVLWPCQPCVRTLPLSLRLHILRILCELFGVSFVAVAHPASLLPLFICKQPQPVVCSEARFGVLLRSSTRVDLLCGPLVCPGHA